MIVILIFFIAFILQLFFPWWIIGIVALAISAWQAKNGKEAFLGGFTAIFLLWMTLSLWKSFPNEHILANRVGQMLMLPDWPYTWILVVFVTALIGGLTAGVSGLSGYFVSSAFLKDGRKK